MAQHPAPVQLDASEVIESLAREVASITHRAIMAEVGNASRDRIIAEQAAEINRLLEAASAEDPTGGV